jgi:quercetin dioxygenase-like cupin family protein
LGGESEQPADLLAAAGTGPVWGLASDDLNATVLAWPAGHEVAEHVNAELDVLIVMLEGHGTVLVDDCEHALAAGHALLVPKGSTRSIRAGAGGVRYLSVHRRRGPLQIEGAPG